MKRNSKTSLKALSQQQLTCVTGGRLVSGGGSAPPCSPTPVCK